MKKLGAMVGLVLALSTSLGAQTTGSFTASPAEQSIAEAHKTIEKNPNQADGYNMLALALARRAREISDVSFYAKADKAIQQSQAVAPGNFGAEKAHIWVLLGKHEFSQARDAARELNKRVPDDVLVYGFLADANSELGNYDEAEKAVNWMLKLRPGNIPGLTRAAYLRELFGMIDGAFDLMRMALESTPASSSEDRAWILTQMAHLRLSQGRTADADKLLQQALTLFLGYHYALGNLAKVRIEQKRSNEAVSLLEQRFQAAPHAENLYDLAEALQLAGKKEGAARAFSAFEAKAVAETNNADNSNRELIFYYADHANQPLKAIEVAKREYAHRRDVYTLDAYAWALHRNGQNHEARVVVETALAVGITDAQMLSHAGEIALALGDRPAAERYLARAVELHAPGSERALQTLAKLTSMETK